MEDERFIRRGLAQRYAPDPPGVAHDDRPHHRYHHPDEVSGNGPVAAVRVRALRGSA